MNQSGRLTPVETIEEQVAVIMERTSKAREETDVPPAPQPREMFVLSSVFSPTYLDGHLWWWGILGALVLVTIFFWCSKSPPKPKRSRLTSDFTIGSRRDRVATDDGNLMWGGTTHGTDPAAIPTASSTTSNPAIADAKMPTASEDGTSLVYEAYVPPQQLRDVGKQLTGTAAAIPPTMETDVKLDLVHGTLVLQQQPFALSRVHLQVKPPALGGVLDLTVPIVDHSSGKRGMALEHTFPSASCAAQFQADMLAHHVVGPQIRHMYEALHLIQKGSASSPHTEFVLHDKKSRKSSEQEQASDENEEATKPKKSKMENVVAAGPAWDDVMRALGVHFAPIRERLLQNWAEVVGAENRAAKHLVSPYPSRRALLGPVDFFRLFVPALTPPEVPVLDSSPSRMESMLKLRTEVAQAAAYVEAYVNARVVVNCGWSLSTETPAKHALKRRLAYDGDLLNRHEDATARNEFYEATVSRDVLCEVHSQEHLARPGATTSSEYQAYSMVDCQAFDLDLNGGYNVLQPDKDPVLSLPSLQRLVSSNPELDFFVSTFFPADGNLSIAIVKVFVRSLPKEVDAAFDTVLERFRDGDDTVKRRKLEVFVQLGPNSSLGPLTWAILQVASFCLGFSRHGEPAIPCKPSAADSRTSFPGLRMSNYTQCKHYVGPNYLASNARVVPSELPNFIFRALYRKIEDGVMRTSDVDFTYVLEGEQEDELPERALATDRFVHVDPVATAVSVNTTTVIDNDVPWSPSLVSAREDDDDSAVVLRESERSVSSARRSIRNGGYRNAEDTSSRRGRRRGISGSDAIGEGVSALADILGGVKVPFRTESLSARELEESDALPVDVEEKMKNSENTVLVDVLSKLSRNDLKRFFIASHYDLSTASSRIVNSMAWRGATFPIDTRKCRVELQNGQFFSQGKCRDGNPVMYFRNYLLGPWRGNEDGLVDATLHRLDHYLKYFDREYRRKGKKYTKVTLVVLMGKPEPLLDWKRKMKRKKRNADGLSEEDSDEENVTLISTMTSQELKANPLFLGNSPRLSNGDEYYRHSNKNVVLRLLGILGLHYPERLSRALVVPGKGHNYGYYSTTVGVRVGLRSVVASDRTRSKIFVLRKRKELRAWIEDDELVTLVGGNAPVHPSAFAF